MTGETTMEGRRKNLTCQLDAAMRRWLDQHSHRYDHAAIRTAIPYLTDVVVETLARSASAAGTWLTPSAEPEATPREDVARPGTLCRTCMRPITHETRTEPGYLPREGWYDDCRIDALVCFRAVDYRHVPLTDRERAYFDAGFDAALAGVTA